MSKDTAEPAGAFDLLKTIAYNAIIWLLAMAFFGILILTTRPPRDDTDPPEGRSGLGLKTDHDTGCQYLVTWSGGITPRVSGGRHAGCHEVGETP